MHIPFQAHWRPRLEAIHSVCIGTKDGIAVNMRLKPPSHLPGWIRKTRSITPGNPRRQRRGIYASITQRALRRKARRSRLTGSFFSGSTNSVVVRFGPAMTKKGDARQVGASSSGLGKSAAAGKPTKNGTEPDSAPTTRKAPARSPPPLRANLMPAKCGPCS